MQRLRYLGRRMDVPRSLVVALGLGAALVTGCYSEQLPPSTYRYACEGDGDCNRDEICRRGVCERPCTQLTAADDCPFEDGYAACFNGVCASTCELERDYCPASQECLDLGIEGGGGNPFGGSSAAVGICGIQCDADDNADLCPEGETCIPDFGTCAVVCDPAAPSCPEGYSCLFGFCAPEGTELPTGSEDGGAELDPEDGRR